MSFMIYPLILEDGVAVDLDAKQVNWLQATKPVEDQGENIKPDKDIKNSLQALGYIL